MLHPATDDKAVRFDVDSSVEAMRFRKPSSKTERPIPPWINRPTLTAQSLVKTKNRYRCGRGGFGEAIGYPGIRPIR